MLIWGLFSVVCIRIAERNPVQPRTQDASNIRLYIPWKCKKNSLQTKECATSKECSDQGCHSVLAARPRPNARFLSYHFPWNFRYAPVQQNAPGELKPKKLGQAGPKYLHARITPKRSIHLIDVDLGVIFGSMH